MEKWGKYHITKKENKVPEMHRLWNSPTKGIQKEVQADSRAQTVEYRSSEKDTQE